MKTKNIYLLLITLIILVLAGCGSTAANQDDINDADSSSIAESFTETLTTNELVLKIISDMGNNSGKEIIDNDLKRLVNSDEAEGKIWTNMIPFWEKINMPDYVNVEELPDDLPADNSLCIVVLGYQLNRDGTMRDELVGRCSTALNLANKYPECYVLVTGGPTASGDRNATEADMMANWLMDNGVSADRIIIENRSMTTGENALFSYRLLAEGYGEVNSIAIVTSDYHVPLGSLVFQYQFLMGQYYYDDIERNVISNVGYNSGSSTYFDRKNQAYWVQSVYNVQ